MNELKAGKLLSELFAILFQKLLQGGKNGGILLKCMNASTDCFVLEV